MPSHSHLGVVPALLWLCAGALVGAPVLWLALGLPLLGLALRRPGPEADRRHDELALRRQLAIARRRGTPADLVRARAAGVEPDDVAAALRISDFPVFAPHHDGSVDLMVLVDGSACDRPAVEQRLLRTLGGTWSFSWARFPDDGPTLDALVEHLEAGSTRRPQLTTTEGRQ